MCGHDFQILCKDSNIGKIINIIIIVPNLLLEFDYSTY